MNLLDILLKIVLPILVIIITQIFKPLVEEKISKEQMDNIKSWVEFAVIAAEQMEDAGLITIPKKEFVLKFIADKTDKLTEQEMNILVESVVKELFNSNK